MESCVRARFELEWGNVKPPRHQWRHPENRVGQIRPTVTKAVAGAMQSLWPPSSDPPSPEKVRLVTHSACVNDARFDNGAENRCIRQRDAVSLRRKWRAHTRCVLYSGRELHVVYKLEVPRPQVFIARADVICKRLL